MVYLFYLELPLTPEILSRDGSLTRGLKPLGGGRLPTWLTDAGVQLEQAQRDAALVDLNITQLTRLLNGIEAQGSGNLIGAGAYGDTEVSVF